MERNFFRRIEISFPVLEPKLKQRVLKEGLKPYLADNSQAWEMDGSGEYRIKPTRRDRFSAQELLLADMAVGAINVA
jgi:polyphosphate kinase